MGVEEGVRDAVLVEVEDAVLVALEVAVKEF